MSEDDLFQELNGVLEQYRRMQEGFRKARVGLETTTHKGRLRADPIPGTDARLRTGACAYERANYHLADVCERFWGAGDGSDRPVQ